MSDEQRGLRSECTQPHPKPPVLCAHFEGENAVVYATDASPSGYEVVSYRTDRPGSVTAPIPEPLAEMWCGSWVRREPGTEGLVWLS